MGDRCYVFITVEKERSDELANIVFGRGAKACEVGELFVCFEGVNMNWAAWNDRTAAAAKGILFYGFHRAGAGYGPGAFFAVNGEMHEAQTGHDGGYVLQTNEYGDVAESSLAGLKEFIRGFKDAKNRLHNPLYALTQSDACT